MSFRPPEAQQYPLQLPPVRRQEAQLQVPWEVINQAAQYMAEWEYQKNKDGVLPVRRELSSYVQQLVYQHREAYDTAYLAHYNRLRAGGA